MTLTLEWLLNPLDWFARLEVSHAIAWQQARSEGSIPMDPEWKPTSLLAEIAELRKIIKKQAAVIEKQGAEIERLKARKPSTFRNSSKPPSTDGPWSKRISRKKPSGKKRGGQPGHKGAQRYPALPDDMDEVHVFRPDSCSECPSRWSAQSPTR